MKIVLCVKQVPDTSDIKWTENNTIQRDGLESIMNPFDVYALENSLFIKKKCNNVHITALSMGPKQAEKMLRKTIALGVDDAILLCDKKFAGADTYATSKTLATAINKKINDYDLIICGQFAVDGDTAQTGPGVANFLDIPHITYVKEILECNDKSITVIRELDDGIETVTVGLPAVICVLKGNYEPTRARINGIISSYNTDIKIYGIEDIGLFPDAAGLKGSPTYVSRAFRAPKREVECEYLSDVSSLAEVIKNLGGQDE